MSSIRVSLRYQRRLPRRFVQPVRRRGIDTPLKALSAPVPAPVAVYPIVNDSGSGWIFPASIAIPPA